LEKLLKETLKSLGDRKITTRLAGFTPLFPVPAQPSSDISIKYIPNQWIVSFASSDWLLKPGIVSAISLPTFFSFSGFCARVFPHSSEKRELFGAGYPLVWYILITTY